MLSPHDNIIQFVLEKSAAESLSRRASIYRSLAEIIGLPEDTKKLKLLADELERAEARCSEFAFQFSNPKGKTR